MRTCHLLAALTLSALVGGCGQTSFPTTNTAAPIVWIEKGIAQEGVKIDLGYRSSQEKGNQIIEPIAAITREGKSVANAMVFCSLVSADPAKNKSDEVATYYKASNVEEPAHYGHQKLEVLPGISHNILRFRIILPGIDQDWTHDLKVELK
jgi:hypothetical protein